MPLDREQVLSIMATKQGLIVSVPKEPGSDEYVTKSVDPMDVLDSELMTELREMVRRGGTILDLIRRVQSRHDLAEDEWFWPVVYMVHTFFVRIPTAKDIVSGCLDNRGHYRERVEQDSMQSILAQREMWDAQHGVEAKQPPA